jgi:hypothetical protein
VPFVENWAGPEFAGYVDFLGGELETLAAEAGAPERARMAELYRLTLLYEIAFWEMAGGGRGLARRPTTWPRKGGGPAWNGPAAPPTPPGRTW